MSQPSLELYLVNGISLLISLPSVALYVLECVVIIGGWKSGFNSPFYKLFLANAFNVIFWTFSLNFNLRIWSSTLWVPFSIPVSFSTGFPAYPSFLPTFQTGWPASCSSFNFIICMRRMHCCCSYLSRGWLLFCFHSMIKKLVTLKLFWSKF